LDHPNPARPAADAPVSFISNQQKLTGLFLTLALKQQLVA
jgi:hypothetical protein